MFLLCLDSVILISDPVVHVHICPYLGPHNPSSPWSRTMERPPALSSQCHVFWNIIIRTWSSLMCWLFLACSMWFPVRLFFPQFLLIYLLSAPLCRVLTRPTHPRTLSTHLLVQLWCPLPSLSGTVHHQANIPQDLELQWYDLFLYMAGIPDCTSKRYVPAHWPVSFCDIIFLFLIQRLHTLIMIEFPKFPECLTGWNNWSDYYMASQGQRSS